MIGTLIARSAVRKGFDAVMRNDLEALISVFHQDATVIYPTREKVEGLVAIKEFYRHFLETFPRVRATVKVAAVENLFDFAGTNTLTTLFEVDTTNQEGVTYHQEGMQLIRLHRGKIKLLRYFFADTVALASAWDHSEQVAAAAATSGPRKTP